jgi:hypothetical protein
LHVLGQVRGECELGVLGIHQPAQQSNPVAGQLLQRQGVPPVRARQHRMRLAELGRIGHGLGGQVIQAKLDAPLVHVTAPVAARHPRHPAGGQQHLAPRGGQLVGDLRA